MRFAANATASLLAAPALAQKPDKNATLSIAAAPASVAFGGKVQITGTHYRVTTVEKPTVRSDEAAVAVRWRVGFAVSDRTPMKGKRVRFFGTVKPANPNAAVYIQRQFAADGWRNVKQTTLSTSTVVASGYSTRLRVRKSGKYRVVVLAAGGYDNGISRARKLFVH